ncbi:MAG: hypothetical protein JW994_01720 [Candidatus Omnitrophica bacterium]|nr:hypothetical protein [Candidatus Omnitrophota bacterium]
MKMRIVFLAATASIFLSLTIFAYCQGPSGWERAPMMNPRYAMMNMIGAKIVATEDGGIVILVGNKLIKYDKELNLVKETEVKVDVAPPMGRMMPPAGMDNTKE